MEITEKEPHIFVWINLTLWVLKYFFFCGIFLINTPYYWVFSFFMTIVVIVARKLLNNYINRDVKDNQIRIVTRCKTCEGSPYTNEYENALSYGTSDAGMEKYNDCYVCKKSRIDITSILTSCEYCGGSSIMWSEKRRMVCICISSRFMIWAKKEGLM